MPEVPEGWMATTPPAKFAPCCSPSSPCFKCRVPLERRRWTDLVILTSTSPRSFIDIFLQHWAAQAGDIQEIMRANKWHESVNPRCPEGSTPLDWAVDPDVCELLLSSGGRTTRIGSDGRRVLCGRQETLDQFKRVEKKYVRSKAVGEDLFDDSASEFIALLSAPRMFRLPDSLKRSRGAEYVSHPSMPWHKPTQALIYEDLKESPFQSSSKTTGVADISCSPMSWHNTTEAPTPEKGSPYPMSRYLGSSAGSAAISIRGSSYRSSYQNPSFRQTSLLRMAMVSKESQGQHKLIEEDWEQHELWATPRLPTPRW